MNWWFHPTDMRTKMQLANASLGDALRQKLPQTEPQIIAK